MTAMPSRSDGLIAGMRMPPSTSAAATPRPNTELPTRKRLGLGFQKVPSFAQQTHARLGTENQRSKRQRLQMPHVPDKHKVAPQENSEQKHEFTFSCQLFLALNSLRWNFAGYYLWPPPPPPPP